MYKTELLSAQKQFMDPLKEIRATFIQALEKRPGDAKTEPFMTTDGEMEVTVWSNLEILGRALETVDS